MNRRLVVTGVAALVVAAAVAGAVVWSRPDAPAATAVEVGGDIGVHDPALVVTADAWYVYSTGDARRDGGAPQVRRSTDEGATWQDVGVVWDTDHRPTWVYDHVPAVTNYWAPEVVEHDGTWYLYYAASTFGSNTSLIGLMTSPTLDPDHPDYAWTDQGEVWRSSDGDDYNAIDAGVLVDADGTAWMSFGSFWGGIQLLELDLPSGKPADGAEPVRIAARSGPPNAIEAPYLVQRDGWYYLFVSRDACCQGTASTYNIAVARSRDVTGPYVGQDGTEATADGATQLLGSVGYRIGPGGQSFSGGYLAFHYYDAAQDGVPQLAIRELAWTADGWPVVATADELAARPAE